MPRWAAILATVAALLTVAPFVLGFAYSLLGVPAYGLVCGDWQGILKGTISADGYRVFLMNRGCDLDEEIRRILQRDFSTRSDSEMVQIVKGERKWESADEILTADGVRAVLRTFRPIIICGELNRRTPAAGERPNASSRAEGSLTATSLGSINACYRGVHQYFNEDIVGALFGWMAGLYAAYLVLNLNWSINLGADLINAFADTGPLVAVVLILAYMILFWMGKLLLDAARDVLKEALKKKMTDRPGSPESP
jgi:hypothetical protein